MDKPESAQVNVRIKLTGVFEIQTNYLNSSRRSDLVLINKKKIELDVSFWETTDWLWKKDKIETNTLNVPEIILKKTVEHEVMAIAIVDGGLGTVPKSLGKRNTENQRKNWDYIRPQQCKNWQEYWKDFKEIFFL